MLLEGHKLRDHVYDRVPLRGVDEAGTFDCAIVGGGISGLASALFFQRSAPGRTAIVLEDHAIFGGLARQNEFAVGGERLIANQASAMFFPPLPDTFLAGFYRSIGIDRDTFEYQAWRGPATEMPIGPTPYFAGGKTSAFYFGPRFNRPAGQLLVDPWGAQLDGAPIDEQARRDLLAMTANTGARAKAQPKQHGDADARRLDAMTFEQHLMELYGISRETVRTFLSPVSGGGSGLGADALSAYADYAADVLLPWRYDQGPQMFPGGNAGVARHIVRTLIPDAISGPDTLAGVEHGRVNFRALDRAGQASAHPIGGDRRRGAARLPPLAASRSSTARAAGFIASRRATAIVAGGSWTARHIVKELPDSHREAYAQFHRSPCLVANVAVRHWRFLHDLGIHECQWFEGIGNFVSVRKMPTFAPVAPTIAPDSPAVLTLKILFSTPGLPIAEQVARGRAELLSTPFRDYERRIREQLTAVFGRGGFDAARDVAAIVLNRWGHAYLSAQPGFFFGLDGKPAPGEVLRQQPVGPIAFANSDVTGIMDHRASIVEAQRAVSQVV